MLFQEASIMYFVHSDCLSALDLGIHVKNESERRLYTVATVETKEYCYAKKVFNFCFYITLPGMNSCW